MFQPNIWQTNFPAGQWSKVHSKNYEKTGLNPFEHLWYGLKTEVQEFVVGENLHDKLYKLPQAKKD